MNVSKTILIIDDEQDMREMLQYELQSQGYNVVIAENGLEGLKHLKEGSPHLILLDLNMPIMGGIEFFEKIKDSEGNAQYPIIALTAQQKVNSLFEGFNVNMYFAKPFNLDQLTKAIKLLIGEERQHLVKLI